MIVTPRSYQIEAVQRIYDWFADNQTGNPIVAMPTGTGKSVVIAMFLESIFKQWVNQKILCLTHVKELIAQNYQKLLHVWPTAPAGIYSAGLNRRDTQQKILFCGIASIAKRAAEFAHVDLVLIDECHLVSSHDATMYRQFLNALLKINPKLRVIGFTATKWRLGQGDITEDEDGLFTDTCFDITTVEAFNRLIAEGYLAPLIPKPTQTRLNIDGVHMRGGEFIPAELQQAVNKESITEAALREAIETCGDRNHWLIFAAGVEHADAINDMLHELGVSSASVHSKMSSTQRDKAIADFKAGRIRAVVNNNVLTTGFDFPEIDLIICLRPTASAVLWVQMLGRGTRPADGKKNCMVLDFASNTRRLGPINDPVIPRKKGKSKGEAPIKLCPSCNTYQHASVRFCQGIHRDGTACTHEFIFETKLKQGASTDQLIKGDLPIVEKFKINHITFTHHRKEGRPPAIRVSYYVNNGYQKFDEFVCIEHQNYAGKKARDWMRLRVPSGTQIPSTTEQAMATASHFKVPSAIKVWINRKYPEIMGFDWDENQIEVNVNQQQNSYQESSIEDDDIPF